MIPRVSKKRKPCFRARKLEGYRREESVHTVAKESDFLSGCYFRFVYFLLYLISISIQSLLNHDPYGTANMMICAIAEL